MRTRNIEIILYTDNDKDIQLLDRLTNAESTKNYEYAYIKHDKDINAETGEVKKEHIHLQIFYDNARDTNAIANDFDIEENRVERIKNKIGAIQYLTHYNNPEKAQYEIDEIRTNIKNINEYFTNQKNNEVREIKMIFEYIKKQNEYIKITKVQEYALKNEIWSTYRRNVISIKDAIQEHNNSFKRLEDMKYER